MKKQSKYFLPPCYVCSLNKILSVTNDIHVYAHYQAATNYMDHTSSNVSFKVEVIIPLSQAKNQSQLFMNKKQHRVSLDRSTKHLN